MITFRSNYIDGQWKEASGEGEIAVINPATEKVVASVPDSSARDVDLAVEAAHRASAVWRTTTPFKRGEFLEKIQSGLESRMEDLAATITREVGMPIKLSRRIQAGLPCVVTAGIRNILANFAFEEEIGNSKIIKEPVGVVACITPWNYPLHQVVAKVVPALAAGCTVVLKPSEQAPLSAYILTDVIHAAGVPAGVFNLVSGRGTSVGEALAAHPDVDMVSFTGSPRAGRRIAELASATVKKVALELGGKSASLLLDNADLETAVRSTLASCFLNSGQTCNALTRLVVPETQYERVVGLVLEAAKVYRPGDPFLEETRMGPLVSEEQRRRVLEFIARGCEEGAELLTGGTVCGGDSGYFVEPTVFGRVTPGMTIAREEIFGPVLSILSYRDEEEAIAICEDTPYGLAAAVWSNDLARAERIARRLRVGQVDINGGNFNPLAPFGGYKLSGYGRELGRYGLEEFLAPKALQFRQ